MKVICLMGPTAVGKSEVAVRLALMFGGEVVNADSMQVYKYLPISTAAPTAEHLAAVPHHLYAFLNPNEQPDAGLYARLAASKIREIVTRGHVPIVTGGTFFWMRALFEGLSRIPPVPIEVRNRIRQEMSQLGPMAMHERLAKVDPQTAARLRPSDTQRIERALEVFEATGTPLSVFQAKGKSPAIEADVFRLVLHMPRDDLYRRIEQRVDSMFQSGLVDEVKAVLGMGFGPEVQPLRSATIRPVVEYIYGIIDEPTARSLVSQGHRNYAKRQLTWLRSERYVQRVAVLDQELIYKAVATFLNQNSIVARI